MSSAINSRVTRYQKFDRIQEVRDRSRDKCRGVRKSPAARRSQRRFTLMGKSRNQENPSPREENVVVQALTHHQADTSRSLRKTKNHLFVLVPDYEQKTSKPQRIVHAPSGYIFRALDTASSIFGRGITPHLPRRELNRGERSRRVDSQPRTRHPAGEEHADK